MRTEHDIIAPYVAEIEHLKKRCAAYEQMLASSGKQWAEAQDTTRTLQDENERLLKDAERIREELKRSVALSKDVHQEEPVGYLVFSETGESVLFYSYREADDMAHNIEIDSEEENWPVYPLYAGEAIENEDRK